MNAIDSKTSSGQNCKPRLPARKMGLAELKTAYDEMAPNYESKLWFDQNILGIARLRKQLMSKAQGKILDLACGTGLNFPYFPEASEITGIDLSPVMLDQARQNADTLNLNINLLSMDAAALKLADNGFDTVVSALSTCTFPDPVQALREMRRVCKPYGQILLLEHGHSSWGWLANYQDRQAPQHYQANAGCRWNQDPLDLIVAAGLSISKVQRSLLGMFFSIEAMPNK